MQESSIWEVFRSRPTVWSCVGLALLVLPPIAFSGGVNDAKRQFPEHCWPVGKPFSSPAGIPWAKPLAGGPISVLLILPHRASRLAVELEQRFEVEADVVWLGSYEADFFSWGDADRVNARLSRSAKPYDAIILTVPLRDRFFAGLLRENVDQGTGLILVYDATDKSSSSGLEGILPAAQSPEEASELLRGIGWRLLPPTKDGRQAIASVGAGIFGKGRVITLGYNTAVVGWMPYGYALNQPWAAREAWWEHVYCLIGRSLLHCSQRTMPARVIRVAADAHAGNLSATVAASQPFQGELSLQWTEEDHVAGSSQRKNALQIAGGQHAVVTWPIPKTLRWADGNHVANFFLRDEQSRATDWFSAVVPVHSEVRIDQAYPFPRDWYRAGEKIEGTMIVENGSSARSHLTVSLELFDAWKRCVWRETKTIELAAGEKRKLVAAPQLDRVLTVYHRLRATVSDDRGALARQEWELRLPDVWKYDPTEFRFGVETSFNGHIHTDKVLADYFRSVGAAFSADGGVYDQMPRFQLPWTWTHMGGGDLLYNNSNSPNREHCFRNPAVLGAIAEAAALNYPYALRSGMVFSSIADELELVKDGRVEVCFCPFCAQGFRQWAERFYGSLDRLNAEWATAYQSWDEVKPITAEAVRERGNYAQWVDFRGFMEDTVAHVGSAVRDRVERSHPGALVGLTNPFAINPFSGHDLAKLAKVETAVVRYMRQDLLKEDISLNPSAPSFSHFGYGGRPEWCRWYPWWFAMNRGQFLVWYQPEGGHPLLQLVDCLGRPTQRSIAVVDTLRDLLRGLGKVFRSFPPVPNSVAILHSQSSMHTAWAESGMRLGDIPWGEKAMYRWMEQAPLHGFKLHHRSQENFKALVKESSLQPDFLPADQLSKRLSDYQILILPYSTALSDDAVARIDAFVAAGGTLLADLRTGAYSEHGKPLAARASVEALFGLKRTSPGFDPALTSISSSDPFAAVAGGKGFDQPAGHESLQLTTGRALAKHADGAPALVVNVRGKGRAIYLNFVPGSGPASAAIMKGTLELAQMKRDVWFTIGDSPAIGYECFLFQRGRVRFMGLLRDMQPQPEGEPNPSWNGHQFRHAEPQTQNVTIHLSGEYHVYDARAGKYLGRSATVTVEMGPAEARVLALLPYQVTQLSLEGLKPHYRQADTVRYAATVVADPGPAGDHVLHVEAVQPDGKTADCYSGNVLAPNGRHEGSLPLALDENPGTWTIRVTDVASGTRAVATFNLSQ